MRLFTVINEHRPAIYMLNGRQSSILHARRSSVLIWWRKQDDDHDFVGTDIAVGCLNSDRRIIRAILFVMR